MTATGFTKYLANNVATVGSNYIANYIKSHSKWYEAENLHTFQ